MEPELIP